MPIEKKPLNIADWISVYRISAAPILIFLMILNERTLFTWFLGLSLASDIIDGMVARYYKMTTQRGAMLDSIGDTLTYSIGAIGVWFFETEFFSENIYLVLLAIVPYVLQISIALIKNGKPSSFHTYLAKCAALLQGVFMLILLFSGPVYWLFYAAVGVTLLETVEEIILLWVADKEARNVKGLYWVLKEKKRRSIFPIKSRGIRSATGIQNFGKLS